MGGGKKSNDDEIWPNGRHWLSGRLKPQKKETAAGQTPAPPRPSLFNLNRL